MPAPHTSWKKIAFQGELGANAHVAAQAACPKAKPVTCPTFDAAFAAVRNGKADGAMIPFENSIIGRIADIHHLLPQGGLHIVGEYYLPIHHQLLAPKNATLKTIKEVHSQGPALAQCVARIKKLKLTAVPAYDTAGAAKLVAKWNDPTKAALASKLAGEIYGLKTLNGTMNDADHNTTRFILLGREAWNSPAKTPCKTSLLFTVKSIPAALYKSLGGFATNAINLTKIESYMSCGRVQTAQFYIEAEAHTENPAMKRALAELKLYANPIKIFGCYPIAS